MDRIFFSLQGSGGFAAFSNPVHPYILLFFSMKNRKTPYESVILISLQSLSRGDAKKFYKSLFKSNFFLCVFALNFRKQNNPINSPLKVRMAQSPHNTYKVR